MSTLTLWHGSVRIIERPVYGAGKTYNDYGKGFYCTEHEELAKEWACAEKNGGYANRYKVDAAGLKTLDLQDPPFTILHWLAVLSANRRFQPETALAAQGLAYLREYFLPNLDQYDLIRGYRADDSYFSFARAFVGNAISLDQLSKALYLGELGEQIVLRSKPAFERIRFDGYEPADGSIYYLKRKLRDEAVRSQYRQLAMQMDLDGIFMRDILRDRLRPEDIVLRV